MLKKTLIIVSLFAAAQYSLSQIEQAQKLVVTVSAEWDSSSGAMYLFDKIDSKWVAARANVPVCFGRSGLAWGDGLFEKRDGMHVKKEGDKRSPAGVFEFGSLYGLDSLPPEGVQYPYHQITKLTRCVDDGMSKVYNQIIEEDSSSKDWNSAENMHRVYPDYKYVLMVDHNPKHIPGEGSCIFFHINRTPTTGCTSMDEPDMRIFLQWLDPHVKTVLIQLPKKEYEQFQKQYMLPAITINQ
ncbi:MAG: L,D-transpeptidase family protein [Bacteroidota bacterium]|jgi:D-alanyl-D-alanine dipeptidase